MNSFETCLVELLRDPMLWGRVAKALQPEDGLLEKWDELTLAQRILLSRGIVNFDSDDPESELDSVDESAEALVEIFQENVIDKLPKLARIVAADLASIAVAQLAGIRATQDDQFGAAVRRTIGYALAEIDMTRFGDKRFKLGGWVYGNGMERRDNWRVKLWSSPSGVTLAADLRNVIEERGESDLVATGLLYGGCTETAMSEAEELLFPIIVSVVKTVRLARNETDSIYAERPELDQSMRQFLMQESTDEPLVQDMIPAPITFLTDGDGGQLLRTLLTSSCRTDADDDDTLLERIRNATVLLAEADRIALEPVSLSLSFAAIEALVCEENEAPVNRQIKKHVSTLLVHDATKRKAKEKVIGNLYDIRCMVMHGARIQASSYHSYLVRRIAAGLLRSVVCWRLNQQRYGGSTSWKELMDELTSASRKPSFVVGTPDLGEFIPLKLPKT